ncbi:MAG: hypothetical protein AAGU19_20035 [Prolixibacteraceae bacterium]
MEENKRKSGLTRRESLQIGAGLIAGMAFPFSGLSAGKIEENLTPPAAISAKKSVPNKLPENWIHDLVVVSMPAAAIGGKKAGVYTAAENGVIPWNKAIIRWLTSKSVRGNGAVLIRQEGPQSGGGLIAVIDPFADYYFEVSVHVPGGHYFGTAQEDKMQVWLAVLDLQNNVLVEEQVELVKGQWKTSRVSFSSQSCRKVRCVVYAKSVNSFPCVYYAEGFRLTRKDYLWWDPQNYFNSARTADQLTDNRKRLLELATPDAVAGHNGVYLNWDNFFTNEGMLVGGGNWEQEYNHVSIDDPMLEELEDNGIARELDEKKIGTSLLWPGYQMCHHAPAYYKYYIDRVTRIAPEVNLFTQDNINNPSFQAWGKGCFCKWCREKFQDWLEENRKSAIVKRTGIIDFRSFDIAQYVNKVKVAIIEKGNDAVLKDPILKSYILFSYVSHAELWRDSVSKIKKAANHPIAVMGNQYGNNGEKPYSVVLSRISDVVCTESNIGANTNFKRFDRIKAVLLIKLGLASGEFRRPVWLQFSSLFHSPVAAKSRLRFVYAQSLANNGLPLTWATSLGSSGWFFDIEAEVCRFMQRYRFLYSRCQGYSNVGLVYSLPTHLWRKFSAFELASEEYLKWFYSFANLLEDMHVPYEVNCWWHPSLGTDEVSLERLSRYKLLILPGVDCFTDGQLEALQMFQKQGGHVINIERPSLYDQNVEARCGVRLSWKSQLVSVEPRIMDDQALFTEKLIPLIAGLLGNNKTIETDAPADVWSSLQIGETGEVLSLHLVNGNINEMDDSFSPLKFSNWKIRLPKGLNVDKARVVRLESPDDEQYIPVRVTNGWASVIVPLLESYTVINFYSGNALIRNEEMARRRRSDLMTIVKNS